MYSNNFKETGCSFAENKIFEKSNMAAKMVKLTSSPPRHISDGLLVVSFPMTCDLIPKYQESFRCVRMFLYSNLAFLFRIQA